MSYLLKNNRLSLNLIRFFSYFILSISIIIGTYFYDGNKLIFFIYGIFVNLVLLNSFYKNHTFFETYFGVFVWLGFWFKFLFIVILFEYHFKEGISRFYNESDKITLIDNTLVIGIVFFTSYLLACRANFFLNQGSKTQNLKLNEKKYENLKKFILSILIIFILFIAYFNFKNAIYQRGLISGSNYNFLINSTVKWLLLFGFSSMIVIFLNYNFIKKKKSTLLTLISLIEPMISNLSFLSRGGIFNSLSILYGIYKSNKRYFLKINIKHFIFYIFFVFIIFFITVSAVNILRPIYFSSAENVTIKINKGAIKIDAENVTSQSLNNYTSLPAAVREFYSLAVNRWVGIDSLLAVTSYDNKNFKLLQKSFSEEYDPTQPPFYERIIQDRQYEINNNVYGITTPGIVAFLFYSGSYVFLFLVIFVITLLFIKFEKLIFHLSQNLIFCSLISQVIAYRLIHFGYLPKQSYLLFGSIIITIFIHTIINKFFMLKK